MATAFYQETLQREHSNTKTKGRNYLIEFHLRLKYDELLEYEEMSLTLNLIWKGKFAIEILNDNIPTATVGFVRFLCALQSCFLSEIALLYIV